MKKVVPIKSSERELDKFHRAVKESQCQPDGGHLDQVVSTLLEPDTKADPPRAPEYRRRARKSE
jgi:hypothetical protein